MLSASAFVSESHIGRSLDVDELLALLCQRVGLSSYIVCKCTFEPPAIEVVSAWPVPIEPFNGAQKVHLETLIDDCSKYPKIHCHSIPNIGIGNVLHRLKSDVQGVNRAWFVPLKVGDGHYIFFGFPQPSITEKTIPQSFVDQVFTLLEYKHSAATLASISRDMAVLERYVREAGHDIASAVQATIAKLSNISNGLVPMEHIPAKAAEAEAEIMAVYRVAEGLGLTMEPNYQVRDFERFDLVQACERAIALHASEAEVERHIVFETRFPSVPVILVGDARAFEQLLGHLLSNAIKYAFGSSRIFVNVGADHEYTTVKVINKGIKLPEGADRKRIWDFGFRGDEARGRHVNGSGIGLYTVRKIALAHQGTVSAEHDVSSQITTFYGRFPLEAYLRKTRPELFVDAIVKGTAK